MNSPTTDYSNYFAVERHRGSCVVRFVPGTALDARTIRQVADDLYELVNRHGLVNLVIDLTDVRQVSSQAPGTLINLLRKTRTFGGCLRLTGIGPENGRLLRTTRLDRLFPIHDTVAAALAAMDQAASSPPALSPA